MKRKIKKEGLRFVFRKVYSVLEKKKVPYLVIGGIASGILGRPRFTEDVDLLIFISKEKVELLLDALAKEGFYFDRLEAENSVLSRGVFRVSLGKYHADFIINAVQIGKKALERGIFIKLWGKKVRLPSPEDMLIFKLSAGRNTDLIDAENILLANEGKIDEKYLIETAQKFCDEVEDLRVWKLLKKLLKK